MKKNCVRTITRPPAVGRIVSLGIVLLLGVATGTDKARALEFGLGTSVNHHTMRVHNREDAGKTEANLSSRIYATPHITLVSEPTYFGTSRFGALFEASVGGYDISGQVDSQGEYRDYGNRVTGTFGHFNPILFYRFGDRFTRGSRHWSLMVGGGYGVSFLSVKGSFITDHRASALQKEVRVRESRGYFLLPAVYVKFTFHNWYAGIFSCFGGPGFVQDDYTYRLIFRTVYLGYTFEL